ncbi:hypothetical protein L207DRAFT_631842 [Hyaloscypha variabilis F]|uniref:RRM domain-containing protein n=1 Tax=Hyaloscypha variabilis (strain UAMH 11265 / GT02V1 / F) TaxID=1149755 RepID=A0A2J6RZ82_HYAVF|nr:hypothetical protein L207DRAFT_631842 [Hyaloscypha variabilis F]
MTPFFQESGMHNNFAVPKSGTNAMGTVHDPFVGTSTKAKSDGKLSATASSFQPFGLGLGFGSLPSTKSIPAKVPKSTIAFTTEYLESVIAAEENSPRRGASDSPPAPQVTKGGFFSTESIANRHIKVIGIFIDDVGDRVQQSFDKFNKSAYEQKSTWRTEQVKNVVYIAFADIRDAMEFRIAIAQDHDNISVEFIQVNDLNEINSPLATGTASAYEGQVIVHVQYPLSCDHRKFEEEVRGMLGANNRSIHAWQKLLDREAGTYALVVEFHNVAHVKSAIQELHGKVIGLAPRATILSVSEHRPTVSKKTTPPKLAPVATPIRQTGDQHNLADLLGNMNINKGKAPEPLIMSFVTPVNPAGLSYHPSANPGYSGYSDHLGLAGSTGMFYSPGSQATIGMGMGMSNMFPGMTPQQAYSMTGSMMGNMSTGTTPNLSYDMGSSMTGFSPYAPTSYAGQGLSPTGFTQPEFGRPAGHPPFPGNMHYGSPSHGPYYGSPSHGPARDFGYPQRPVRPVRRENAVKVPYHIAANYRRNQPNTNGNHNVVELDNIRFGVDVRTTVMLRNIPNKVTQVELKKYVDQSSFGRYDFMYLRIDFSNECNVGYAFINFVDPLDIISFVELRSGQKWEDFRSDKRAEVSYATIQGRDCLIQKFRNSSVMLEPETARPKLFYTFDDPMVGQEEPFPASDNHSKLNRSCQNAENVGLFAPSAGQHLRDEQRRRRSQFDRGTSLAEQEEYDLEYHSWGSRRSDR